MAPTGMGGLGAPNIHYYYKAVLLDQLKLWWKPAVLSNWKQIVTVALTKEPK